MQTRYALNGLFLLLLLGTGTAASGQVQPQLAQRYFEEAKALALQDLTQTSALPVSLPFLVDHAYETLDLMGDDFWPYGLESNRHTLGTFARYMHEQGLTPERLSLDALFPDSTHRTFRI